jgi:type IV secretion system protein VirB9
MRKIILSTMCAMLWCCGLVFPPPGECADNAGESADKVEIEFDGKIITVDVRDLIITEDGLTLDSPEKYEEQLKNAPVYGVGQHGAPPASAAASGPPNANEITAREYAEEAKARQWADVVEDLSLREIDKKALELVKEFSAAKSAVPPVTGTSGSVVIPYSSYTPKIVCRPMYVTDIILQPGEMVTGVHPGDSVRWTFTPGRSGPSGSEQIHVLIKPLMPDVSTNLIINTDRRTYQIDLVSNAKNFMPSVSFSYPNDTLQAWDSFISEKQKEKNDSTPLSSGYSVDPEDLHLEYEIRGEDSLRWKPTRVWDDGVKTYILFKKGSVKKSIEAPVLIIFEHKKETLVNYRAAEDMYIVDKVFDSGALIAGTGSHQDRVVIKRLKAK